MRGDKIEIEKSIVNGKLETKTWIIEPISNFVFNAVLIISFPFASGLFLFAQFKYDGNLFYATILLIITLLYSGLLLYSVLNYNKLRKIQGVLKEQNIEFTLEVGEQLGWKILTQDQQLIIARPSGRWFSSNRNREIVLLYDKQDVLINCTYYGLYDFKSPFHWFGNRNLERQLIEGFEQKIKQQTANISYPSSTAAVVSGGHLSC